MGGSSHYLLRIAPSGAAVAYRSLGCACRSRDALRPCESLKDVMKPKAQMFGHVTLDQALELGLFFCGSPATVRKAFENYWNEMRFGNLLVLCHFGALSRRPGAKEFGVLCERSNAKTLPLLEGRAPHHSLGRRGLSHPG